MPLLPIDLQIMFSQLSHVGKEQAVLRDVTPQYQFVQGSEMVQKAEHDDSAVNQSQQLGEGPEKVKEQEEQEKNTKKMALLSHLLYNHNFFYYFYLLN